MCSVLEERISSNAQPSSSRLEKTWALALGLARLAWSSKGKDVNSDKEYTNTSPWRIESQHVERLRLKNEIAMCSCKIIWDQSGNEFEFRVEPNVQLQRAITQEKTGEKRVCVFVTIDSVGCYTSDLRGVENAPGTNVSTVVYGTFCSEFNVRLIPVPDTHQRNVSVVHGKSTANPTQIVGHARTRQAAVGVTLGQNPGGKAIFLQSDNDWHTEQRRLWSYELKNKGHDGFFWECNRKTREKEPAIGCMRQLLPKTRVLELDSFEESPWNRWNRQGSSLGEVNFSSKDYPDPIKWYFPKEQLGKTVKWTMEIELKVLVLRQNFPSPPTMVKEVLILLTPSSFDQRLNLKD